jgi:hypothetical protein
MFNGEFPETYPKDPIPYENIAARLVDSVSNTPEFYDF